MRQFKDARVGDTVRVQFKTLEEGAERVINFEGALIRVRGSGPSKTITVRKISFGVGVERIFPVASPRFQSISVVRRGRVRRAKLYYMRGLSGKAHRVGFREEENKVKAKEAPSSSPSSPAATSPTPAAPVAQP